MSPNVLNFVQQPSAGQPLDVAHIVQACQNCYYATLPPLSKPRTKFPSPNRLLKFAQTIFTKFQISSTIRTKVRNRLKNIIFNIRIQSGQKTKIAPIFHPQKLIRLIETLWKTPITNNIRLSLAKKQAAVQAMICLITGRRWTDVTRLKWDNMQIVTTSLGTFYKFFIPVSKTNMTGARIECVTLKQLTSPLCPVKMLQQLHFWVGQPSNGFIFKCLAPKTNWVNDPINFHWSTYRCKGHWVNDQKHACLGHTSSTQSFGYLHRHAKQCQWKIPPTKHTFRRTCLIVSKHLGISRDHINEGFGWVSHSDMIRHYSSEHDSVTKRAPSVALACYLELSSKSDCLQDLPFINPL